MVQIIVINGVGGSGKDTFVDACQKIDKDIYNLSMIDYVKQTASQLGWNGEKDDKGRRFLCDLKDALENFDDSPYKSIQWSIKQIMNSDILNYTDEKNSCIIFIHAREARDIERLVKDYNAFTVLIRRPSVEHSHTFTNHADLDVLSYHPYDYIYWNIGTVNKIEKDVKDFLEIVDKFGKKVEKEN